MSLLPLSHAHITIYMKIIFVYVTTTIQSCWIAAGEQLLRGGKTKMTRWQMKEEETLTPVCRHLIMKVFNISWSVDGLQSGKRFHVLAQCFLLSVTLLCSGYFAGGWSQVNGKLSFDCWLLVHHKLWGWGSRHTIRFPTNGPRLWVTLSTSTAVRHTTGKFCRLSCIPGMADTLMTSM